MSSQACAERPLAPLQSAPTGQLISPNSQANEMAPNEKRIACKECRQAKIRCVRSRSLQPNGSQKPCLRCGRRRLNCQVDTSYKRVNKGQKITELAKEVERLRSAVDRRTSPGLHPAGQVDRSPSTSSTPLQVTHEETCGVLPQSCSIEFQKQAAGPQDISSSPPLWTQNAPIYTASSTTTRPRALEHIQVSKGRINDLFQIYFSHHHRFFDILDPSISPDDYYIRSPLLFWAIISVAARRYELDVPLLSSLSPYVTKLMWSSISKLPHTLFTVQAILLISMWPYPTNSMSTDPSFLLVSIAKSACLQLGLHRPEVIQDFLRVKTQLRPDEFHDTVKTWVGCYIAAQSVTSTIGQQSILKSDWVIDLACEGDLKYAIPENLRHHLLISRFIARINRILAENDHSPTGQPLDSDLCILINVLEENFVDLERQIGRTISEIHQILILMASLQLRTYYFFITSNPDLRKQGLLKAYTTSVTLISKAAVVDGKMDLTKYSPAVYEKFLVLAAMLLMKIINSSYSKYIDTLSGKHAFDSVLSMFRQSSGEDQDLRGRTGKILTQLWSLHQFRAAKHNEEPTINLKTRLGASLLHDSLWTWREEFGGQRGSSRDAIPYESALSVAVEKVPSSRVPHNVEEVVDPMVQTYGNTEINPDLDELNLGLDLQEMNWLWDVGFPSFLPIDTSSNFPMAPDY